MRNLFGQTVDIGQSLSGKKSTKPKPKNELKELINRLSKEYSAPTFEPHVTLVGEIRDYQSNVIELTRRLARKIN